MHNIFSINFIYQILVLLWMIFPSINFKLEFTISQSILIFSFSYKIKHLKNTNHWKVSFIGLPFILSYISRCHVHPIPTPPDKRQMQLFYTCLFYLYHLPTTCFFFVLIPIMYYTKSDVDNTYTALIMLQKFIS